MAFPPEHESLIEPVFCSFYSLEGEAAHERAFIGAWLALHCALLACHTGEKCNLISPTGPDIQQLHIKDLALLGGKEGGWPDRRSKLWRHNNATTAAGMHSFDAFLKA